MSLPSFTLSKAGGVWFATGKLPSGRTFSINCGKGSRETAEALAEQNLKGRVAASQGSKKRWQKWRTERDARPPSSPDQVPGAAPSSPELAPSSPRAAPAPAPSDEEIRAKLLARGDAAPPTEEAKPSVEPDEVIPPDEKREEQQDAMDDEERELFARACAEGTVEAVEWSANWVQARRKPPRKGEAGERSKAWVCKGSEHYWKKLLGRATLSPAAMLALGTVGMFIGVAVSAVEIVPGPAERKDARPPSTDAQASGPAAPPAPEAAPTNGHNDESTERALVRSSLPLGTFGVAQSMRAN